MAITISGTDGISPLKASGQTQTITGTAASPAISSSSDTDSGIFFGTNEVSISTGGTQKVKVDSAGQLIVGATSGTGKFIVQDSSLPKIQANYADSKHLEVGVGGSGCGFAMTTSHFMAFNHQPYADRGTDTNLTERMRLDANGNLGLNYTSPSSYAETKGIVIGGANRAGLATYTSQGGSDTIGVINMFADSSNGFRRYFDIGTIGGNTGGTGSESNLRFITQASSGNPAERMRLDQDGSLNIGCTSNPTVNSAGPLHILSVNGRDAVNIKSEHTGNVINIWKTNTGQLISFYQGSSQGSVKGSISTNGSTVAYNETSDYRLKENVVDLDGAITRVKQLQPKRFNFIFNSDITVDGFIAHEAQTVVPEAVTGTHNEVRTWKEGEELPDGVSVGDNKLDEEGNTIPIYQGIDKSKLVPLLTAALQEAISKIETLETKVAALEAAE